MYHRESVCLLELKGYDNSISGGGMGGKKDQMSAKEPKIYYFNFISIHIACGNNKLSN